MNEVTSKNIETVTGALEEYLQRIIQTTQFNLQDFVNFMEPKFTEAGYRDLPRQGKNNILIILDALGIGDFMWKTAVIREIRRVYPNANIRLVMYPAAAVMAETCPYIDELILNPANPTEVDFLKIFQHNVQFTRKLLTERTDICFAFTYYLCTPLLMYMSGARERISYAFEDDTRNWPDVSAAPNLNFSPIKRQHLNSLATISVPQFLYGGHNVDISLAPLEYLLRAPVAKRDMEVWQTPFDMNVARNMIQGRSGKIYALAMGGNTLNKHYPPEKYARLMEMILAEEPDATFAVIGGGRNDLISTQILQNAAPEIYSKNVISLVNKVTYRQTAAVLSLCNMYIGNDTGSMHIAAAVKIPCLAVFCYPVDAIYTRVSATNTSYPYHVPNVIVQPEHALPECANDIFSHYGCKATNTVHCISQITPEKVFEGFHLLKERAAEKNIEPLRIH